MFTIDQICLVIANISEDLKRSAIKFIKYTNIMQKMQVINNEDVWMKESENIIPNLPNRFLNSRAIIGTLLGVFTALIG